MTITFLGHSRIADPESVRKQVEETLIKVCDPSEELRFYCGGYGDFDLLCAKACRSLKPFYPKSEIVLVIPYLEMPQRREPPKGLYDATVYPPLENVPLRFAISQRNKWMIREADLIIAYVKSSGGAYTSFLYAERKKKILNLAIEKDRA